MCQAMVSIYPTYTNIYLPQKALLRCNFTHIQNQNLMIHSQDIKQAKDSQLLFNMYALVHRFDTCV